MWILRACLDVFHSVASRRRLQNWHGSCGLFARRTVLRKVTKRTWRATKAGICEIQRSRWGLAWGTVLRNDISNSAIHTTIHRRTRVRCTWRLSGRPGAAWAGRRHTPPTGGGVGVRPGRRTHVWQKYVKHFSEFFAVLAGFAVEFAEMALDARYLQKIALYIAQSPHGIDLGRHVAGPPCVATKSVWPPCGVARSARPMCGPQLFHVISI